MTRNRNVGGSWFGALLGLAVLAVISFLGGALAGLVWKEPGLLFAYLRGDTTEISWSTASAELEPVPPVGAAPQAGLPEVEPPRVATARPGPQPAAPAPPAKQKAAAPKPPVPAANKPAPAAKPAAAPKPPPAVAAAPGAHIAVQVGAFSERSVAEGLRDRLEQAGFAAYLAPGAGAGQPWRVRVGPFGSRGQADQIASRLEREQKLPTWVLDEDSE